MGSPHRLTDKSMPRPHKCSICGKTYAMKWALSNHIKMCKQNQEEDDRT